MSHRPAACRFCQGTLQEGFLVDHGHLNSVTPGAWHAGAPVQSFWTGTRTTSVKQRRVTAFCCDRCGHIELFAKLRAEWPDSD